MTRRQVTYTCPTCGNQIRTGVRLSTPPACFGKRRHPVTKMVKDDDR